MRKPVLNVKILLPVSSLWRCNYTWMELLSIKVKYNTNVCFLCILILYLKLHIEAHLNFTTKVQARYISLFLVTFVNTMVYIYIYIHGVHMYIFVPV